jgi:outer membrane protein
MKKFVLIISLIFSVCCSVLAQRYAIVDTKYILDKMPDYKTAQKQLDQISAQWQKEIDDKQVVLDKMYKDFEGEEVMLSDDLKKKEKMSSSTMKKRYGTSNANDLVLRGIYSKNARN